MALPNAILRFDGGKKREPAIDVWLQSHAPDLDAIAREWFKAMRDCGDEVMELLHDGHPTACFGDAPFGYVNVFTAHVNVGFFHGAALRDPAGILQGAGKHMRHVKLRPGKVTAALEAALRRMIEDAYSDIRQRA